MSVCDPGATRSMMPAGVVPVTRVLESECVYDSPMYGNDLLTKLARKVRGWMRVCTCVCVCCFRAGRACVAVHSLHCLIVCAQQVKGAAGLPLAVQVAALPNEDEMCLRVMHILESEIGFSDAPPLDA